MEPYSGSATRIGAVSCRAEQLILMVLNPPPTYSAKIIPAKKEQEKKSKAELYKCFDHLGQNPHSTR